MYTPHFNEKLFRQKLEKLKLLPRDEDALVSRITWLIVSENQIFPREFYDTVQTIKNLAAAANLTEQETLRQIILTPSPLFAAYNLPFRQEKPAYNRERALGALPAYLLAQSARTAPRDPAATISKETRDILAIPANDKSPASGRRRQRPDKPQTEMSFRMAGSYAHDFADGASSGTSGLRYLEKYTGEESSLNSGIMQVQQKFFVASEKVIKPTEPNNNNGKQRTMPDKAALVLAIYNYIKKHANTPGHDTAGADELPEGSMLWQPIAETLRDEHATTIRQLYRTHLHLLPEEEQKAPARLPKSSGKQIPDDETLVGIIHAFNKKNHRMPLPTDPNQDDDKAGLPETSPSWPQIMKFLREEQKSTLKKFYAENVHLLGQSAVKEFRDIENHKRILFAEKASATRQKIAGMPVIAAKDVLTSVIKHVLDHNTADFQDMNINNFGIESIDKIFKNRDVSGLQNMFSAHSAKNIRCVRDFAMIAGVIEKRGRDIVPASPDFLAKLANQLNLSI